METDEEKRTHTKEGREPGIIARIRNAVKGEIRRRKEDRKRYLERIKEPDDDSRVVICITRQDDTGSPWSSDDTNGQAGCQYTNAR
jgi:hypothetical protein